MDCYMYFQTLTWCQDLGITEVTIYAFSIENLWIVTCISDPDMVSRPWHHGSDHLCLQYRELQQISGGSGWFDGTSKAEIHTLHAGKVGDLVFTFILTLFLISVVY